MPTKVKGMTSIEIAILVAIVLAIAVAAGWYLYTTFAAAARRPTTVTHSLSGSVHERHNKNRISEHRKR
jgi:Tfp pilus assembly protein PilE